MSFQYLKKMPTPEEIKEQLPVPKNIQEIKTARDKEVADIITGKDNRFLCIIGPCSADNEDAVCEYIEKLARIADDIKDKVLASTLTSLEPQVADTKASLLDQIQTKLLIWWQDLSP